MSKCVICDSETAVVAKLQTGELLQCSSCYWLSTEGVPLQPVIKKDPPEEKRNEYLAIAQKACLYSGVGPNDKVLDVICGDGTLLGWYKKHIVTVGVESDAALIRTALNEKRVDTAVPSGFSAAAVSNARLGSNPKFQVITVIDVFQDMSPNVIQDCKQLLADFGVLVIQTPYLLHFMNETLSLHQNYPLAFSFKMLVERFGMQLEGLEFPKEGIRFYVTHQKNNMFATADYTEKFRLYTTMNSTIITELQKRYDRGSTYKTLESKSAPVPSDNRHASKPTPVPK